MNEYAEVVMYTALAGIAIPVGGAFARAERIPQRWLRLEVEHAIIAFGGGVLLAAVALVLVPYGMDVLSPGLVAIAFSGGAISFMFVDKLLQAHGGSVAQLIAMILDFTPEALALGASAGGEMAAIPVLALLIGLQNLPEGFNSYRELVTSKLRERSALLLLAALAILGPIAGIAGLAALADAHEIVGIIMLFAAGGILYLMFQDIAPAAKLKRKWNPPLGAVAGFLIGVIGEMTIGA
ncbi:MAG: ZIP family metal transporter [Dehalococcoidia bacterium]